MPIESHRQLHEQITQALAEADRLGLLEVGIGLDRARLAMVDTATAAAERTLILAEPMGSA